MIQYDLRSILASLFFNYCNRPKNELVPPPKKLIRTRGGGLWGSENYNLGQICYSIPYFIAFSAVMNLIGVHLIHF